MAEIIDKSIQIKIKNLPQIKAAFARAPALMTREMNIAIRQVVIGIGGQSKKHTQVRTGRLRGSTYNKFANLRGEVGTNVVYDKWVHWGTKYMEAQPYLWTAVQVQETD